MKVSETKAVFAAVKQNVAVYIETKGEGVQVGLDNFSEEMLDKFDSLYEREVNRLNVVAV